MTARRQRINVIDGIEKRVFVANTQNVAAERDFNRLELDGVAPDRLEVGFNAFETEVAAAIDRTCKQKTFTDAGDRALILNLIGLMALRNPRQRRNVDDFQARVAKMMMDLALETPEAMG